MFVVMELRRDLRITVEEKHIHESIPIFSTADQQPIHKPDETHRTREQNIVLMFRQNGRSDPDV
jgi:hypothetical protein